MRKQLEKIDNVRDAFIATFDRFGMKNGWVREEKTVLLINVKDKNNNVVCDHLWFNCTKGFEKIKLNHGDNVRFNARVTQYTKGYKGYRDDVYKPIELDYKLSYPTKIEKI